MGGTLIIGRAIWSFWSLCRFWILVFSLVPLILILQVYQSVNWSSCYRLIKLITGWLYNTYNLTTLIVSRPFWIFVRVPKVDMICTKKLFQVRTEDDGNQDGGNNWSPLGMKDFSKNNYFTAVSSSIINIFPHSLFQNQPRTHCLEPMVNYHNYYEPLWAFEHNLVSQPNVLDLFIEWLQQYFH